MENRFNLEILEEKKKIVRASLVVVDDGYREELDFGNVLCDLAEVKSGRGHIFYQYAISGQDFKLAHRIAIQFLAIGKSLESGFSLTVFEIYLKTINKSLPQFITDFPVYTKLIDLYSQIELLNGDNDFGKLSEFERDTLIKMSQISMVLERNSGESLKTVYLCDDLKDIVIALFYHLLKLGYTFKCCKNCGKRFVPLVNKNEDYCNRPSPQFPDKTCKEANVHIKGLERVKNNEIRLLEKRVYNLYRTAACHDEGKVQAFERFKQGKLLWKVWLKEGKVSEAQYKEWLKSHYTKKYP